MGNDVCSPLFIIGAPRSGTTFISGFFSKTHYGTPFETHFIPKAYRKFQKYSSLDDFRHFKKVCDVILAERSIQQYVSNVTVDEAFNAIPSPRTFRKLVDYFCLRVGKNEHLSWSDKTPWYILELDLLNTIFPDAKYVYIYRDGRDVACSLLEKPWGPSNIYSCAKLWMEHNEKHKILIDFLEEKNQLKSIQYETLIESPDSHIRQVFSFLGVEIDEAYLEIAVKKTKSGNKNKWRNKLKSKQIDVFEAVAGESIGRLGYIKNSEGPKNIAFFKEIFFQSMESLYRVYYLIRLNIVDGVLIKLGLKQPFDE